MIWYNLADSVLTRLPLPSHTLYNGIMVQTAPYVTADDWDALATLGWYSEYREPSYPYMDGWVPAVVGVHPSEGHPVAYIAAGPGLPTADIRELKQQDIDAQVEEVSVQTIVKDPHKEKDLQRELAAASDRTIALQETEDANVPDFDPTISVEDPQAEGVEYNNFSLTIGKLTPWAGAPDNDLGFIGELVILTDDPAIGSEARLIVKSAPSDVSAVLPFTQDGTQLEIWRVTAREGHMWADPQISASAQLLWGAGSLPISPILLCERKHDRQATPVRYGVAV